MTHYTIQITDKALADMEEIYNYIAIQLQAPENAIIELQRLLRGYAFFPKEQNLWSPNRKG